MGLRPSPYASVKVALVAVEICKSNRTETQVGADGGELNLFQWKSMRLNMPGMGYDPSFTWVAKLREDGCTA